MLDDRTYNHRKKEELLDLGDALELLDLSTKLALVGMAIHRGLLLAPWPIRVAVSWKFKGRDECGAALQFGHRMAGRLPDISRELWRNTMEHMVNGKDAYDAMSAGGWNMAELRTFLDCVGRLGVPALLESINSGMNGDLTADAPAPAP